MRNTLVVLLCGALGGVLATGTLAAADAPKAGQLSIEVIFGPDSLGRRTAQRVWRPDGQRLSYLWSESGDAKDESFWTLDPATGKKDAVVRLADLKQGAEDFAIAQYVWSPRSDSLIFLSHGDLYAYTIAGSKLQRLTHTEADEELPSYSPDGARIAFVRDFDLYTLDLATGRETRLTSDGKENTVLNGICDWVYEEEIWNRAAESYWWSPDGSRIAFYRFDETGVAAHPLVNDNPSQAEVNWQKYPEAGAANPKVKVGVVAATGGTVTWLAVGGDDSYVARVDWMPKGTSLAVQHLNRDQNRLDLLRCDASAAGKGACSPLLSETSPTWVNLGDDFHVLPDGRFLWGSDRSGWRRLYLYSADGQLIRPVTPEGWAITGVSAVGEDGTWALVMGFETTELGAIDRHVARVKLGAEKDSWEVLTPEPGNHVAVASSRSGSWVHTTSTADVVPHGEVRTAAGGTPVPLPGTPAAFDPEPLPKWEFFTIPGPEGSRLPARLLKPSGFDPARRYPVISYHYGGPGSQVVENSWTPRAAWAKLMAQRGFVIFMVDNQSSVFFGKAGEDRDYHNLGPGNLAGQLAGVDYLKSLPWVDASRIGLWGWSGGGTNTLFCLLNRPGVWKAGVSGAPVTDWALYDSIWTERYMGRPQDNADRYRETAPLTYSNNLADKLLIVHGLADDNVHAQNSVVMSRDLVKAGKPFEQAFYPGQRHSFVGPSLRHFYRRMTEFFERELQAP